MRTVYWIRAVCMNDDFKTSRLHSWTNELFFILYYLSQQVFIALKSEKNNQSLANDQAILF